MGLFVDTVGTTTPLVGFDETGITYLAATNSRWLPYLADEGIRFVHYSTNQVRRQFGLDQDIPDDLSFLIESPTLVRSWKQCFSAVTVPSSLNEGLYTPPMHGYWQAMMTSFAKELVGSRGFSLIPPNGLSVVISANPRLLLPSKSVLAYARKQSRSAIFEWDEEKKGWYWHAGDYPPDWEKKVKVTNISAPSKKAPGKLKSASKSMPATPLPPTGASLVSKTRDHKRKTTPHPVPAAEQRVSYLLKYLLVFLWLTLLTPHFLFFFSLSTRRTH